MDDKQSELIRELQSIVDSLKRGRYGIGWDIDYESLYLDIEEFTDLLHDLPT